jgi:quercetin dioxygenase-like cupin family protein
MRAEYFSNSLLRLRKVGESICLIRGMMPPGVVVPLHRHEEPELLYVLEGSLEVYRSDGPSGGWMAARVGDIVVIPSNTPFAMAHLFQQLWLW